MCVAGPLEVAGRCLEPGGEQQGGGPIALAGRCRRRRASAVVIRCAPRLSPSTTQAQPNPFTMLSASIGSWAADQVSAVSMLARSDRAKLRWSACRLLRTPLVEAAAASAYHRAWAAMAVWAQPGLGHGVERRTRGCCRATGSDGCVEASSSTMRGSGWRGGRRRRSPPGAGTASASRTNSTAPSGAPPGNVASAHRPRWSSGNNRS